jgi:polar amino acid transport system substrate-binding protein
MLRSIFALICGFALCTAAESITIAFEDGAQPPWSMPDGSGVDHALLKLVAAKTGIEIKTQSMPWKRCLSQMQENKVDGALNASFKEERLAMGCYPMAADGKSADPAKRLHTESYSLYRIKGDALGWDGKAFAGLTGKLGAQAGFSIIDQLKKAGAQVDDEAKDLPAVMMKLVAGRLQGAALHSSAADAWLAANPEAAAKVEKIETPLVSKPYYLMLSKALVEKKPELAKQIWDAIASEREGEAYQKLLAGQ